jgi:hypothetical protein
MGVILWNSWHMGTVELVLYYHGMEYFGILLIIIIIALFSTSEDDDPHDDCGSLEADSPRSEAVSFQSKKLEETLDLNNNSKNKEYFLENNDRKLNSGSENVTRACHHVCMIFAQLPLMIQ